MPLSGSFRSRSGLFASVTVVAVLAVLASVAYVVAGRRGADDEVAQLKAANERLQVQAAAAAAAAGAVAPTPTASDDAVKQADESMAAAAEAAAEREKAQKAAEAKAAADRAAAEEAAAQEAARKAAAEKAAAQKAAADRAARASHVIRGSITVPGINQALMPLVGGYPGQPLDELDSEQLDKLGRLLNAIGRGKTYPCPDGPGGGFDDMQVGGQVVAADGNGSVVATSELTGGVVGKHGCTFSFSIKVPDRPFYAVTVTHRGAVTYSRQELTRSNWKIAVSL